MKTQTRDDLNSNDVQPSGTEVSGASTLPVNLLLHGRRCLMVGGGKIASRKLKHLLDAGAEIVVVAPEVSRLIRELETRRSIDVRLREFTESDLDGVFLVYAATNNPVLNHRVIHLCRDRGILCSAVDGSWSQGDFITPASYSKDGLICAVSSHGVSRRKTRLIKDFLEKHWAQVSQADLLIIGTDHSQTDLSRLESLHLSLQQSHAVGRMIRQIASVRGFLILNTCNRIEFVSVATPSPDLFDLIRIVLRLTDLNDGACYIKQGWEAFVHMAATASGLHAQALGETHIIHQIRQAEAMAQENGWVDNILSEWIAGAIHISRQIRSETALWLHGIEIEELCVEHARQELELIRNKTALVLGSGVLGSSLVEKLLEEGMQIKWFYRSKKPEIASSALTLYPLSEFPRHLADSALVVMATSADKPVITAEHLQYFQQDRQTLLLDLGVPRNVDPKLTLKQGLVKLVNLDDLKRTSDSERQHRSQLLQLANRVSLEHKEFYEKLIV